MAVLGFDAADNLPPRSLGGGDGADFQEFGFSLRLSQVGLQARLPSLPPECLVDSHTLSAKTLQ